MILKLQQQIMCGEIFLGKMFNKLKYCVPIEAVVLHTVNMERFGGLNFCGLEYHKSFPMST